MGPASGLVAPASRPGLTVAVQAEELGRTAAVERPALADLADLATSSSAAVQATPSSAADLAALVAESSFGSFLSQLLWLHPYRSLQHHWWHH